MNVSNGGGGTLSWTAAIADGVDWARISSGSGGSNAGTIQIEIDPNPDDMREFELTVSAAGVDSSTVAVRRADGRPAIEFSADSAELDGEGGSLSLQVRNTGIAPMQWNAALPDGVDWANIHRGEEGTDAGEIVVRYDLNGGFDRELSVRVTASAAVNSPQTLTLSQQWFASSACTFPEARAEFLELMKKWYYFNDDPEQKALYDDLDIDDYASLDAILESLRSRPRDLFFSAWFTAAQADRLFDGQYPSFGFFGWVALTVNFNTGRHEILHYLVADVYADSPAGNAGLERGDRIVSLNGKRIDEMSDAPTVHEEMGPDEEGVEVSFEVEKQSGERLRFSMTKSLIDFPAVPEEHVRIFDTDAGRVGYMHFRGSTGAANERLLEEFAEFNAAGVRNLIVDLRYNAGGSVPIANGLATLIGGPELFENQTQTVLSRSIHNEQLRLEGRDRTTYFGCDAFPTPDMAARCGTEASIRDIENVVFITDILTIFPSELVVAALQPHENTARVGVRTFGKPVGQYGLGFCLADPNDMDSRQAELWPVTFASVNSEGFGDYYHGIQVTGGCDVDDDLSRQLGDPEEARIAAALRYLETGSCGAPESFRAPAQDRTVKGLPRDPLKRLRGH